MNTIVKHLIPVIQIFFLNVSLAFSCDICSSGGGGGMQGVMPGFERNMIGISYQFNRFSHPKTTLNMNGNKRVIEDNFHQQQFLWRHYKGTRWQSQFALPFSVNQRIEEGQKNGLKGLGDPEFRSGYLFLNTGADSLNTGVRQLLLVGGQIRLPLGKYQQRNSDKLMYPNNFQTGSGAWSFGPNAFYSIRKKSWGMSLQSQYTFNLMNELSYSRGNIWSNSMFFFYWKEWNKATFLPSISLNHDHMQYDLAYGRKQPNTGGNRLLAGAGIDLYKNNWNLSLYMQRAILEELDEAQPRHELRMAIGLLRFL